MKNIYIITPLVLLLATSMPSFCKAQETVQTEEEDEEAKKRYIYKWQDEQGNIHISNDLGKVPKKHRSKVERLLQPTDEEAPSVSTEIAPLPVEPEKNDEERQKESWRNRIRIAKERLAEAEDRYKRLKTEREGLFRAWGSPAYAPISVRERAVQIEGELEEAQKEIDEARHELEVAIPEAARKAGIPPGWLRD